MTAGAVRVGVLRHPARTDALALRLRLGTALATAELLPTGLAPSEVLCVRELRDPRPGTLQLDRTPGRRDRVWERAVAGALDAARRGAARPAAGAVPAGAGAVLFADEAELLACLGADWLSGELAARWWWRRLLADGPSAASVGRAWVARPRSVPAALELLARGGLAAAFAAQLVPEVADALVARVAEVHGLGGTTSAHGPAPAGARAEPPAAGRGRSSRPAEDADLALPRPPPWLLAVPEADVPAVPPSARVLLAVSLGLRRVPAEAARPGFLAEVRHWATGGAGRTAGTAPRPSGPPPAGRPPPPPSPQGGGGPAPRATAPDGPGGQEDGLPTPTRDVPGPPPVLEEPAAAGGPAPAPARPVADAPGAAAAAGASSVETPDPAGPGASTPSHRPEAADRAPLVQPAAQEVVTELGGLFFLVDLALHLGLLADFSAPLDRGAGIGPWDLVELLGRELLRSPEPAHAGRLPAEPAADPVWSLLASLSVRPPGRPPAQDADLPDAWQVPASWLDAWQRPAGEHAEWTWSAARGRLRVRHPAGFLLVDVPGTAADLTAWTAPYAHLRPRLRRAAVAVPDARGRPALRWVRRLAQYVRPRLALAVGTTSTERACALVLRRPARILVTASRVDVVLALADHPMEIRVAGLDRDPGWLPAAGRTLAFTFR